MTPRFYCSLVLALALPAAAQQPPAPTPKLADPKVAKNVPRAADGHPDLSGLWTNVWITPLERPRNLATKEFFTPAEALEFEKSTVRNRDARDGTKGTTADVTLAYNDFWWDSGTKVVKTLRTSMVIDPADGRLPPLTEKRQQQMRAIAEARRQRCLLPGCGTENSGQPGPADGPEDRPLMERCLSFGNAVPMVPTAYNNNYQIVQTPNFVGINVEMVHQMRNIPVDGSPHLPSSVRHWVGDSRGHWEGDTFVIDTTNFTGEMPFRGTDENLHLTERLTRIDADTIIYRFTVDDPTAFTKPWTAELPFVKSDGLLYEYACHEGNLGMVGILGAARADEKNAAAKK
jgi:hypothetical protein